MKVIISGGGTGGHVYPAIAVATELRSRLADTEILFIGAKGKMEMEKVPQAGFEIVGLDIMGLQRSLTLKNLQFPIKLIRSLIAAGRIVRRFKPDVAVGFGGYASGPALRASVRAGVPAVIQEQNSYAGITNKLLAKQVDKICVAYEGMERFFPADKIVLTGNPVRQDLRQLEGKRERAYSFFGLSPTKKTLLLFGGSLGARTLNEAMAASAEFLRGRNDIQVLWQMGKLYAERYSASDTAQLPNVYPMVFIDRMDLAFAAADTVCCRAGASTISELCVAGKPAVLVPSPNVAEDHQTSNAMALVREKASLMVRDSEALEKALPTAIELLDNEQERSAMNVQLKRLAKPDAVREIVDVILKVAGL